MPFFTKTVKDWLDCTIKDAVISVDPWEEMRQEAAVELMAMQTAIGLIADLVSNCEIQVYRKGEAVKDNNWYTFNVSANPNQTSAQVMAQWIMNMYYKGESIMVPLSKHLYVADSFAVNEQDIKGNIYQDIVIGQFQSNRTFRADKLYSLKQCDPQVNKLIKDVYATYSDLLGYSKKAYSQNSGEKYAFQMGSRQAGTPEEQKKYMDTVKDNLETFVSAESAALPLNKDQSIQRLSAAGTSTSVSDFPTLRKEVYSVVAEVFHLPAGLLEGNLTSVDQVLNQALTTAIDPLVHKINQELTRKTFSADDILKNDCKIRLDTTSIKHIDVVDVADKIDKLISSGFMSIDEVRNRCDVAELGEDWSTEHYITKNYADIDTTEGGE